MLREGKLKENGLKRSILKEIKKKRSDIIVGAKLGEDCAVIDLKKGDEKSSLIAVTSDPIAFPFDETAKYAVIKSINNLASSGAEPIGITLSVIVPITYEESDIKRIIRQVEQVSVQTNVEIIGGHTEASRYVNVPVITVTGIGVVRNEKIVKTSAAKPGNDIVITKWIGLEGTSIIAKNKQEDLLQRFPAAFIGTAESFGEFTSVMEEAEIAGDFGVSAMHDVSSGGIFAALWEFAEASNVGLDIDLMKIPIRQETIEICEVYGINPYELLSGGSLLVATSDGEGLVKKLAEQEIPASIIGKATDSNDRILRNDDEMRYLDMPKTDEIYKIF